MQDRLLLFHRVQFCKVRLPDDRVISVSQGQSVRVSITGILPVPGSFLVSSLLLVTIRNKGSVVLIRNYVFYAE